MELLAQDVMKKEVISVKENISLFQLQEIFFNENISGAPVIDDEGKLVGIVSKTDLICSELEQELENILGSFVSILSDELIQFPELKEKPVRRHTVITVKDIMTKNVLTVKKSTPVKEVASLMLEHKIHRLIVVENGKVIGLISSMDLLPLIAKGEIKLW